jgi:TonB family protein
MIVSGIFHLFLFLIFIFLQVGIDFTPAEFAEISFVSSGRGMRSTKPVQPQNITEQPETRMQTTQKKSEVQEKSKAEPVNLPKRRMLEEEQPVLTKRSIGKLDPNQTNNPAVRHSETGSRLEKSDFPAHTTGERTSGTLDNNMVDNSKSMPSQSTGTITDQSFTIEGDAANRTIISQTIPQYPPGLQKEAVVKIRFSVLPDGHIGQMIPVQKGDPILEDITMKALRKWRFNPLASNETQKTVSGIITFRYELE